MLFKLIALTLLFTLGQFIYVPLNEGRRCMIIEASFEPIKVEIEFPKMPTQIPGQIFVITKSHLNSEDIDYEERVPPGKLYRHNFKLEKEQIYSLCIELETSRSLQKSEPIYVNYIATQDFQYLIGKIQVPQELQGQQHIKNIYKLAKSISNLNQKIIGYQVKQRKLEDDLTNVNLHKNSRIVSLTFLECLVIVLSGVYQIFALRKFLIEKNLY